MTGVLGPSQSFIRSWQAGSSKRRSLTVRSVAAPEAPAAAKKGAAAKRVKLGSSDLSVSGVSQLCSQCKAASVSMGMLS